MVERVEEIPAVRRGRSSKCSTLHPFYWLVHSSVVVVTLHGTSSRAF